MLKKTVVTPHVSRSIDVIRGVAALGVIWGHSIYDVGKKIELNGAFWVWVFLPISGYLVARGFDDGGYGRSTTGFGRFLWNRSLRIVPLSWLALTVGAVLAVIYAELPETTLYQFAFVPPLNGMSLVGPLWTIATEVQFYVVAILIVPIMAQRRWVRAVLGMAPIASLWVASAWITGGHDANPVQPRTLLGNLPFFVFGVWLASAPAPFLRLTRSVKVLLVIALVAEAWYLQNYRDDYFWRWGEHAAWPFGGGAACALLIAMVVVCVGVPEVSGSGIWSRAPGRWLVTACAWCGFYTYGIYVIHALLTVFDKFMFKLPPGVGHLAFLLLAVPLAPLSYRFFENRLLRFRQPRQRGTSRLSVPATEPAVG